jgi:hypothetical protein
MTAITRRLDLRVPAHFLLVSTPVGLAGASAAFFHYTDRYVFDDRRAMFIALIAALLGVAVPLFMIERAVFDGEDLVLYRFGREAKRVKMRDVVSVRLRGNGHAVLTFAAGTTFAIHGKWTHSEELVGFARSLVDAKKVDALS